MKVFVSFSQQDLLFVDILAKTLKNQDIDIVNYPDVVRKGETLSELTTLLRSADVFIAIVNPLTQWVLFELGVALGVGKPVIIVASDSKDIPSDIASIPFIQLTNDPRIDSLLIAKQLAELSTEQRKEIPKFDSAKSTLHAAVEDPNYLDSIDAMEFENLVARFFQEHGFNIHTQNKEGFSEIDLVIKRGRTRYLIEIKKLKTQSLVSVETIRKLLSIVSNRPYTVGVIITTSGYTASALALGSSKHIIMCTLTDIVKGHIFQELKKHQQT